MDLPVVTPENYYSPEMNMAYMGSTQFKAFEKCEAAALAELRGEYTPPTSQAFLVGGYIDAWFSGELPLYQAQHPEIFKRDGTLKVEYVKATEIVARLQADELYSMLMSGKKQVIRTGVIADVPFKVKIDSLLDANTCNVIANRWPHTAAALGFCDGAIVDQKIMRDTAEVWSEEDHCRLPFVEAYGYDLQGAIYQAIEGHFLPFILAVGTKEDAPDLAALYINDDDLAAKLAEVEDRAPRYQAIKEGKVEPRRCEHCAYCRATKCLTAILDYRNKSGQSEEVTDDYRLRLLNEETGDLLDAFQWKCTLVRDYLLPGNGYTYVDWVSNRIDGLYYVDPMQVSAEIGADPIFKTAHFFIGGRSYRDYEIMRILRNTRDGVTGSGLVAESPIQLETMLNALKYENRMVKTGAKKGFLKVEKDKKVSQTVLDQLRNSWRKMYGPDSEETTVILNDGVDFKDAGQTAVETQLNENKQTNAHEIYRIFNIAPTILEGDATAEDLKNTVRFAIAPVVKALQLAINRFCLLEAEKGVLAFEIDMDALDGTDMLARYQAYEVAIRNGWMQLDEVRYDEGRNPLGLKFIRLGLDTVIYDPESRMIYTPNTKEWASIDQKGGGEPIAGRDPSG